MKGLKEYEPNFNLIRAYTHEIEDSLKNSKECFIKIKLETVEKYISGWSPIYFITEVPISWDLILDTPYIQGSTIKGIIRDYFKEVCQDENVISCLFGDKNREGKVIFLDAYPYEVTKGNKILEYDIITPHYNNPENDEYKINPVPIKFLSINKGVRFVAFISFDIYELNECSDDALQLLIKALLLSIKMGWGRRTTRGYGGFKIVENEKGEKEVDVVCPY